MKKLLFTTVLILLPLILLIIGLEGMLRVAGFGYRTAPMIQVNQEGRQWWIGNPDFTRLFFPAGLKRLPPPNRVAVEKPAKTRRYMVLGGSAAAGDPDTDFSIARILDWILDTARPDLDSEVLNLAYTACNSHVAREVARQAPPLDLDGMIILVGNNEVIGPYGAGTTLTQALPSARNRNWQLRLRKTRLGQLGQILRERAHRGNSEFEAETWQGMRHFLEHRIGPEDPRLDAVYAAFRENLKDIGRIASREEIPAVLATVPVNLADQPPFQDGEDLLPQSVEAAARGFLETGKAPFPTASVIEMTRDFPDSALLQFVAGSLLLAEGEREKALPFLKRARDLDRLRFRADTTLNEIIRECWKDPEGPWIPVEAMTPLQEDNPRGVLGFPHFYEHVHFTFRANFLIAREIALALLEAEGSADTRAAALQWTDAAAALGYTSYETWRILEDIGERFQQAPFTAIPGYPRITGWMDQLRESLLESISRAEEKRRINQAYIEAIRNRPQDDRLKLNLAGFYASFERPDPAYELVREILPRHPTDTEALLMATRLAMQLGRWAEAEQYLDRLEGIFPEHPGLPALREDIAGADSGDR